VVGQVSYFHGPCDMESEKRGYEGKVTSLDVRRAAFPIGALTEVRGCFPTCGALFS